MESFAIIVNDFVPDHNVCFKQSLKDLHNYHTDGRLNSIIHFWNSVVILSSYKPKLI